MKPDSGRFRSVRARTLRQEIADVLQEAILSAKLQAGERLVEDDLAQEFEVSRIPIREALSQLAQQGIVTMVPNQGARVVQPSQAESYEAMIVRMHLELLAARLATARSDLQSQEAIAEVIANMAALMGNKDDGVEQILANLAALDWEFHQRLMTASGSTVLNWVWSVVGPYLWVTDRYGRILRQKGQPVSESPEALIEKRVEQHETLLKAIRSGNLEDVEQAVKKHYAHVMSQEHEVDPDLNLLSTLPWLGNVMQPEDVASDPDRSNSDKRGDV